MKTVTRAYALEESDQRISYILDSKDTDYEEVDYIPSPDRLTYSNGFHVNKCSALFIDIRGSSELTKSHTTPVLGKMYRAFLSECVAIMNQDENCKQIYINGDCVSGIFETKFKGDIDKVFLRAAQLNSFLQLMNWRFAQKGYVPLKCGIGMDFGSALMLQGGFYGSGINEIIWMGDVVNNASNLCHEANKGSLLPIQMSKSFHGNLANPEYLALIQPVYNSLESLFKTDQYQANVVSVDMDNAISSLQKRSNLAEALRNTGLGTRALLGNENNNTLRGLKNWF